MERTQVNIVVSFFYYMWNGWCKEECKEIFGNQHEHFWEKWCSYANPSSTGATERFFAGLDNNSRELLINRACESYSGTKRVNK